MPVTVLSSSYWFVSSAGTASVQVLLYRASSVLPDFIVTSIWRLSFEVSATRSACSDTFSTSVFSVFLFTAMSL